MTIVYGMTCKNAVIIKKISAGCRDNSGALRCRNSRSLRSPSSSIAIIHEDTIWGQ